MKARVILVSATVLYFGTIVNAQGDAEKTASAGGTGQVSNELNVNVDAGVTPDGALPLPEVDDNQTPPLPPGEDVQSQDDDREAILQAVDELHGEAEQVVELVENIESDREQILEVVGHMEDQNAELLQSVGTVDGDEDDEVVAAAEDMEKEHEKVADTIAEMGNEDKRIIEAVDGMDGEHAEIIQTMVDRNDRDGESKNALGTNEENSVPVGNKNMEGTANEKNMMENKPHEVNGTNKPTRPGSEIIGQGMNSTRPGVPPLEKPGSGGIGQGSGSNKPKTPGDGSKSHEGMGLKDESSGEGDKEMSWETHHGRDGETNIEISIGFPFHSKHGDDHHNKEPAGMNRLYYGLVTRIILKYCDQGRPDVDGLKKAFLHTHTHQNVVTRLRANLFQHLREALHDNCQDDAKVFDANEFKKYLEQEDKESDDEFQEREMNGGERSDERKEDTRDQPHIEHQTNIIMTGNKIDSDNIYQTPHLPKKSNEDYYAWLYRMIPDSKKLELDAHKPQADKRTGGDEPGMPGRSTEWDMDASGMKYAEGLPRDLPDLDLVDERDLGQFEMQWVDDQEKEERRKAEFWAKVTEMKKEEQSQFTGEAQDERMPSVTMMLEPHTHREMHGEVMFPGNEIESRNIDMKYQRERLEHLCRTSYKTYFCHVTNLYFKEHVLAFHLHVALPVSNPCLACKELFQAKLHQEFEKTRDSVQIHDVKPLGRDRCVAMGAHCVSASLSCREKAGTQFKGLCSSGSLCCISDIIRPAPVY